MRKLIAAFKISADGKCEGPQGYADWVDAWSEDYGLSEEIDACVLGGLMYQGYEPYWTAIQNAPNVPLPMTGKLASPDEVKWGQIGARMPHYVVSQFLKQPRWPNTQVLTGIDGVAALKQKSGKSIYLMGGTKLAASLMDAGLVDEVRLIAYPLLAGEGKTVFSGARRHPLSLKTAQAMPDGRLSLVYGVG